MSLAIGQVPIDQHGLVGRADGFAGGPKIGAPMPGLEEAIPRLQPNELVADRVPLVLRVPLDPERDVNLAHAR